MHCSKIFLAKHFLTRLTSEMILINAKPTRDLATPDSWYTHVFNRQRYILLAYWTATQHSIVLDPKEFLWACRRVKREKISHLGINWHAGFRFTKVFQGSNFCRADEYSRRSAGRDAGDAWVAFFSKVCSFSDAIAMRMAFALQKQFLNWHFSHLKKSQALHIVHVDFSFFL